MDEFETAMLLQHGVTKPSIDALEAAGYDCVDKLGPLVLDPGLLATLPDLSEEQKDTLRRALGWMVDVGYSTRS